MGIILFSIPFFFVLIALELAYSAGSGRRLLRLNDSLSDLACGILSQLSGVFTKLFSIGIYIWVESHLSVQRWLPAAPSWPEGAPFARADVFPWFAARPAELASWVAVFVLVDFCYYWSHRLSHGINVLWAGHVVHHSSEEYNLAVALRQSSLHGLMTWIFYVPLALIGVPWRMYVAVYALNLVYQFWIQGGSRSSACLLGFSASRIRVQQRVQHRRPLFRPYSSSAPTPSIAVLALPRSSCRPLSR